MESHNGIRDHGPAGRRRGDPGHCGRGGRNWASNDRKRRRSGAAAGPPLTGVMGCCWRVTRSEKSQSKPHGAKRTDDVATDDQLRFAVGKDDKQSNDAAGNAADGTCDVDQAVKVVRGLIVWHLCSPAQGADVSVVQRHGAAASAASGVQRTLDYSGAAGDLAP